MAWIISNVLLLHFCLIQIGRKCKQNDYKRWEVADPRNDTEKCLLGKVQAFERRDPTVKCLNGYNYTRLASSSICACTREDFEW